MNADCIPSVLKSDTRESPECKKVATHHLSDATHLSSCAVSFVVRESIKLFSIFIVRELPGI